jgi:transcriptional regulator with XRE-family HTH domain
MNVPWGHIHRMSTLKDAMTARQLTDAALAAKVGATPLHISKIRRGWRKPSPGLAVKIEAETGVPAMKLVLGGAA